MREGTGIDTATEKVVLPSLEELFLSFLRLGLTAFGGPAMVAYIRKMAVERKRWLDEETFRDGVALCQTIPGATAMQTAAYVGLRVRGAIGAGASFLGFGLPAFLLMTVLSALYARAHTLPKVISAFDGLQAVIVAIVANATVSFGRASLKNWKRGVIAGVAAALFGFALNPILVILLAAFGGLVLLESKQLSPPPTVDSTSACQSAKPLLFLMAGTIIGFFLLLSFEPTFFDLAALMFRIDLFAFGGGFASVPLMFHEIIHVRAWMDAPTFLNAIVLGQITPGPIVITATFVGYWLHGLVGGLIATVSVFLPSFMMVLGFVPYFDRFRTTPYFNKVIGGIFCSFVGLLLTVTFRFANNVHWDLVRLLLAGAAFAALLRKVDVLWVVVIGTVVSVLAVR
jgi:chromate transporter